MRKYFTSVLLLTSFSLPVFASDAIFSNSETETFNLLPSGYNSKPFVTTNSTIISSNTMAPTPSVSTNLQTKAQDSNLSDKNFINAVNNLDTAQVELREQLTSYSALMAQAKQDYINKKEQYNSYKKQYNALKKKNRQIEKSKKIIQGNIESYTTTK